MGPIGTKNASVGRKLKNAPPMSNRQRQQTQGKTTATIKAIIKGVFFPLEVLATINFLLTSI
jgi:hypothetical protein